MANMATLIAALIGVILVPACILGILVRFTILILVAPVIWLVCFVVGMLRDFKSRHKPTSFNLPFFKGRR